MPRIGKTEADWIRAGGQRFLIDGGIDAVRLPRLTQDLNVSTRSFYHYSANLDAFHEALAAFCGSE